MSPSPFGLLDTVAPMFLRATALTFLLAALPLAAGEEGTISGAVRVRGGRDSRDVVVYIEKAPGMKVAPPAAAPVVLDQKNLVFVPHVLAVQVGTRVRFPNSDEIRHNVFSPRTSPKLDLGSYAKGDVKYYTFDTPGVFTLLCNIHAEMSAYVVAVETPWFAVSRDDGTFTIRGVPAGTYTLKAWHERAKPSVTQVEVRANAVATVSLELKR